MVEKQNRVLHFLEKAMALDVPTPCVFFSEYYSLQENCSFCCRCLVGNIRIVRWNTFADTTFRMFFIIHIQAPVCLHKDGADQCLHITLKRTSLSSNASASFPHHLFSLEEDLLFFHKPHQSAFLLLHQSVPQFHQNKAL
jgi:hypothetical protein